MIHRFIIILRKQLARIIIYSLVLLACFGTYFVMQNLHERSLKISATEAAAEKQQKKFDEVNTKLKQLVEKRKSIESQGIDTSSLNDNFTQINSTIFKKADYETGDNLIAQVNVDLDNLVAQDKAKKEQEALAVQAIENTKGDLVGVVTCSSSKCSNKVTVNLLSGAKTTASLQTDAAGNYNFHVAAGKYNLSISSSGFTPVYKANVKITSQTKMTVNINLLKVVPESQATSSTIWSTRSDCQKYAVLCINTRYPNIPGQVQTLADLINAYRASKGLESLDIDTELSQASQGHADWSAQTGILTHYDTDGSMITDRWAINYGEWFGSEIIEFDRTPEGALKYWQNSPPHNAAILDSSLSALGIGINSGFYVVDFY